MSDLFGEGDEVVEAVNSDFQVQHEQTDFRQVLEASRVVSHDPVQINIINNG